MRTAGLAWEAGSVCAQWTPGAQSWRSSSGVALLCRVRGTSGGAPGRGSLMNSVPCLFPLTGIGCPFARAPSSVGLATPSSRAGQGVLLVVLGPAGVRPQRADLSSLPPQLPPVPQELKQVWLSRLCTRRREAGLQPGSGLSHLGNTRVHRRKCCPETQQRPPPYQVYYRDFLFDFYLPT